MNLLPEVLFDIVWYAKCTSAKYITNHVLMFNHNKTSCIISGRNPFVDITLKRMF